MRVNPDELSLKDKVVFINRVAKVVKGGKRFNFCALVVVGDGHGMGRHRQRQRPRRCRRHCKGGPAGEEKSRPCPAEIGTIPHEVHGLFGGEHVLLKPAVEGTGIIAGGAGPGGR